MLYLNFVQQFSVANILFLCPKFVESSDGKKKGSVSHNNYRLYSPTNAFLINWPIGALFLSPPPLPPPSDELLKCIDRFKTAPASVMPTLEAELTATSSGPRAFRPFDRSTVWLLEHWLMHLTGRLILGFIYASIFIAICTYNYCPLQRGGCTTIPL